MNHYIKCFSLTLFLSKINVKVCFARKTNSQTCIVVMDYSKHICINMYFENLSFLKFTSTSQLQLNITRGLEMPPFVLKVPHSIAFYQIYIRIILIMTIKVNCLHFNSKSCPQNILLSILHVI